MDKQAYAAAILGRRSCRSYTSRPVEQRDLELVLQAGNNAPSAHNSRPWKFAVATEGTAAKTRLIRALSEAFRRDLEASKCDPAVIEQRLERSRAIFTSAPVLILPFAAAAARDNPLDGSGGLERQMAVQSVSAAAAQMQLMAAGLGLGMCWFCAPLFCPEAVCDVCGLSCREWAPQCLLTLGYPAGPQKEKRPPTLEDAVLYI